MLSDDEIQMIKTTAGSELPKMRPNRFFEPIDQLRTGLPHEAVRGLEDRMVVNSPSFFKRISKGVEGIQEEVDELAACSSDPDVLELKESVHYILFETTCEKGYDTGVRDQGRGAMRLSDFVNHPNAKHAHLHEAEVVAIRLYTLMGYIFMNIPLRDDERYARNEQCPLPVTTHFACNGIKKLRGLHVDFGKTTLWRGLRNLKAANDLDFFRRGATELGFMSMTRNLGVAVRYSLSQHSLLFKVVVEDFMTMGADVQWLSAFPSEREILYPPLMYLKPTGRTQAIDCISFAVLTLRDIFSPIAGSCIARCTCNGHAKAIAFSLNYFLRFAGCPSRAERADL